MTQTGKRGLSMVPFDRSFDIEFWQKQGDEAIFSAAWEMVELTEELKTGKKPIFQKTVTVLKHFPD